MSLKRWFEGDGDPVANAVDIGDQNQFLEFVLPSSKDPLETILGCEAADEEEGCERGTHLDDFYRTFHKI